MQPAFTCTETESSRWGQVFPRAILAQSACPHPFYSTVDISRQWWRCPEAPGVQSVSLTILKLRVHAGSRYSPGQFLLSQHVYCHCIPPLISPGNIGDALRLLVCSQLDHIETESSRWGQVFPKAIRAQSACPHASVFQHMISQVVLKTTLGLRLCSVQSA